MTVIAWDGKSIAADKAAIRGEILGTTTKLFKGRDGYVLGICGTLTKGLMLVDWFNEGADKNRWPEFQLEDDWSHLISVKREVVHVYCQEPLPLTIEDPFGAWGIGAEFAIGAMAMGATAEEAVMVANKYSVCCGQGVDIIYLGVKK